MPKVVDHDAYRIELLDAALTAFASEGYSALSMRGLSKSMGVSTGTLYHYFSTKQDLFAQAVRRGAETAVSRGLARVEPLDTVAARFDALLTYVEDDEAHLQDLVFVLVEQRRGEERGPETPDRDALTFVRAALVAHIGLPEDGASLLLATVTGWLIGRRIDPAMPGLSVHRPALAAWMAGTGCL